MLPSPGDRPARAVGIACPRCGSNRIRVQGTRPKVNGSITRYRACRACGKRFTTSERIVTRPA